MLEKSRTRHHAGKSRIQAQLGFGARQTSARYSNDFWKAPRRHHHSGGGLIMPVKPR